ncbi:ATP-binding protein [Shewanella sp. Choline-02u-19]|uniref:ATP-binding protein n=1 Tax=unclassified Shewanella TaxID=196818 RepID=UPI000C34EBFD|nr:MULTISPECIES: ATP-binding protein [unclassified Shewanella]PKG56610.1 ATP-binding protein [Shewanella sp. GutDb-MelDb]PKG75781.1 ATP-binding protein [Shewanella sp. GutCb]PKH60631.1 ATP-binding protein [Shewanella sp. Bg11-22]PKI26940.1 ATP-binding protein [Shewanella sp. Choline-02u-19]
MNSIQINLNKSVLAKHSLCLEIEQFMLQNHISSSQRFKIVTCVLEAVANVMDHANNGSADMTLILHNRDNKVIVDLLDHSTLHCSKAPQQCPDTDAQSGRGLWIMHSWMDNVRVQKSVAGTHLQLSLSIQ